MMIAMPRMHKCLILFGLMAVVGLFAERPAQAQDAVQTEGSLLPDIDPQDIEIRTQYRARFPGLWRQPILGFTPGSRVFQVDPDRRPYFEELDEIAAQLPVSALTRPDAPSYHFFPYADFQRGYVRAGAGNLISPEAELYLAEEFSENRWISAGLNYLSADGHLDQRSSFRDFDADVRYRGQIGERSLIAAGLGGGSGFNYLVLPDGVDTDLDPGRKSIGNFRGETRFKRYANPVEVLEIGFLGGLTSIGLSGDDFGITDDLTEWDAALDGSYTWAGQRMNELFTTGIDLQAGGYDLQSGRNDQWHIAGIYGNYSRLFNYRTQIDLTLGVQHGSDAVESSEIFFAPDLTIQHSFSDHVTLTANLSGKAEQIGQLGHHRYNRFLLPDNPLRNAYHLQALSQLMIEPLAGNQVRMGVSYRNTRNHAWFDRLPFDTGAGTVPGHYTVRYDDATILKAFGGIGVDLVRERVWFDVEGYIQTPTLSDDRTIPFEEEYGFNGALTIRPVDPLLFEVWGSLIGPRITPDDRELSPFIHAGSKLELRITERVGIYGKILNLLNQEYEVWEGFIERPFQIYGGITLHL